MGLTTDFNYLVTYGHLHVTTRKVHKQIKSLLSGEANKKIESQLAIVQATITYNTTAGLYKHIVNKILTKIWAPSLLRCQTFIRARPSFNEWQHLLVGCWENIDN